MIIKAYEHQKIKKIKNNIFLFYGENDGYKSHVINSIFIDNYKGNVERFDESEILNNFENFISSLINKSFFDDLKLIIISRVSEKIVKLIDELLDRKINDVTIVLNASNLEKKCTTKCPTPDPRNIKEHPDYQKLLTQFNIQRDQCGKPKLCSKIDENKFNELNARYDYTRTELRKQQNMYSDLLGKTEELRDGCALNFIDKGTGLKKIIPSSLNRFFKIFNTSSGLSRCSITAPSITTSNFWRIIFFSKILRSSW